MDVVGKSKASVPPTFLKYHIYCCDYFVFQSFTNILCCLMKAIPSYFYDFLSYTSKFSFLLFI